MIHERRPDWAGIRKVPYSREKLAMQLRLGGIGHMGEIKGAYVEANGQISIFKYPKAEVRPGLPVMPPWDVMQPEIFDSGKPARQGHYPCLHCANTTRLENETPPACPNCGGDKLARAWKTGGGRRGTGESENVRRET